MKRWVILTVVVMMAAVIGGGLLLSGLIRGAAQAQPVKADTESPKPELLRDPDPFPKMEEAMKAMGYEGQPNSGNNWRAKSCDYQTYLVSPDVPKAEPFFFIRSITTGEMQFLRASEVDQALKQHVTYDGRFLPVQRGLAEGNQQYSLGSKERNGELVFVYVAFDEAACGLKADEVVYWAPWVNEKLKLSLQLLPKQ